MRVRGLGSVSRLEPRPFLSHTSLSSSSGPSLARMLLPRGRRPDPHAYGHSPSPARGCTHLGPLPGLTWWRTEGSSVMHWWPLRGRGSTGGRPEPLQAWGGAPANLLLLCPQSSSPGALWPRPASLPSGTWAHIPCILPLHTPGQGWGGRVEMPLPLEGRRGS